MRFLFIILCIITLPVAAQAQETQPGDPCTAGQLHQMRQVGGPGNGGTGATLVCDGATWNPVFRWNAETGEVLARIGNDTADCEAGHEGAIRYSSSCLQFCDGDDWISVCGGAGGGGSGPNPFSFADATDAPLNQWVESNIALIHGLDTAADVMISGDGTPEYRICADNTCSSVIQNWGGGLGSITNGQYLQVRLTSAAAGETTRTADPIVVGGFSTTWNVTTTAVKLVFVTSVAYNGDLGNVTGAHAKCTARAAAASLPGTYKAWIAGSLSSSAPVSHFTAAGIPYVRPDGVIVANNWSDLTDGSLQNAIATDEFGNAVTASNVWTNVTTSGNQNGSSSSYHCSNWGSDSASYSSTIRGSTAATNANWTASGSSTCNTANRLYCFEQ